MVNYSQEYLAELIRRFNSVENIKDQWEFVQNVLEKEQYVTIENWLNDNIKGIEAKERIKAIRWLLNFIQRAIKQGESALKIVTESK